MRKIELRKVSIKNDVRLLYDMMLGEDQYLFSTKLSFCTIDKFEEWIIGQLKNSFHDFYVAEMDGIVIGYAHNYDFSLIDSRCKIAIFTLPNYRKIGLGGLLAISFIKRLFVDYPLNKIYLDIYSYNNESIESNLKAGFVKEGELPNYRYYDGTYHSMQILSMTREVFEEKLGGII